ncbi:glycosyltransferase [Pseudobacteroides cellulosolvens]|uniref:Glycosyl transferase group 1 n=1 Tax=Pseudobacteroides cellulosolvens ATCC 35603 = DSM 2933 TaxID=398512 RepID=A0A0L6JUY6_9FIRM|nr:glycosyltransferase [Pseudobacteroides cellulosolvens]KNY29643.1 glycosyl transferase group 1 [Pseudobacteroides cellulosolvens ATCC 35603 = DSM 2933]
MKIYISLESVTKGTDYVLNILHVLPTDKFSGAEKVAEQICLNVDRNKFNVVMICNGGTLIEKYKAEGINTVHINVNKINIKNLIEFKKVCILNRIDIVHAHGFRASMFALVVKKLFLRKLKIISHIHECSEWLMRKTWVRGVDRVIRNSYSINLMCGQKVLEHYTKYGSYIDKSNIRVLSNAIEIIDPEKIDMSEAKIRQGNEFIFGFIGCLAYRKGLISFLQKLSERKEILDGAKIVIVGDGDQREELEKIVGESMLAEKILFLGHQDDIYKYLIHFDLFILPSIVEGLPMVILEAMSIGKPALVFDVGSLSEVVKDRETGYLVKPQDYAAFFEIMNKVKSDKNELNRLGLAAKQHIENEFCINKYIKSVEDIYLRLMS